MTDPKSKPPESSSPSLLSVIESSSDWPFSLSELAAGLRRYTGDSTLTISDLKVHEIRQRRPAVGKLRGLCVHTSGEGGTKTLDLVLKQTQGSTRAGAAGAGLREISIYRTLKEHLPLNLPELVAAHPKGEWLVMVHLPAGRRPENWIAADYLLAAEKLAVLHDRFWSMDMHLSVYPWLEQPLNSDRDIYVQGARSDAAKLAKNTRGVLSRQTDILTITEKIVDNIDMIVDTLRNSPATLLHGDYWPGNILIETNSRLTVYDWEDAAIGPAVLDLLSFLQGSSWAFSPLPISPAEIIEHYRSRLAKAGAHAYSSQEFELLWDYAVMWTFVGGWTGRLANTPETLLPMRLSALEEVLFSPLRKAYHRRLN